MLNSPQFHNLFQKIKNIIRNWLALRNKIEDIVPSYFKVTENYFYKIDIAKAPEPRPTMTDQPNGLIEIITPRNEWEKIDGRSHHLDSTISFTTGRNNLQYTLSNNGLHSQNGFFPLHRILWEAKQNCRTHTTNSDNATFALQSYRIELKYEPETLQIFPVTLMAEMYDEDKFEETSNKEAVLPFQASPEKPDNLIIPGKNNAQSFQERQASHITKQKVFFNFLRLQLQFELILPNLSSDKPHIRGLLPDELCITEISLRWPVITSVNQFRFSCKSILSETKYQSNNSKALYSRGIAYNPATKSLFLGQIGFETGEKSADDSVKKYQTPFICLDILTPSDLYQDNYKEFHQIRGNATIKIPKLLSGLTFPNVTKEEGKTVIKISRPSLGFIFSDIAGGQNKLEMPFEEWSKIHIEFNIEADRLFERRPFSPYQHLEFPNVIFNELRLVDIQRLLQDMQFSVGEPQRLASKEHSTPYRVLMEAWRPEGAQIFWLWIVVEGKDSRTVRQKEIPGNERFTSAFPTGNMKIYIQGRIEGDKSQTIQIITDIHNKLKNRFKHVTVVE